MRDRKHSDERIDWQDAYRRAPRLYWAVSAAVMVGSVILIALHAANPDLGIDTVTVLLLLVILLPLVVPVIRRFKVSGVEFETSGRRLLESADMLEDQAEDVTDPEGRESIFAAARSVRITALQQLAESSLARWGARISTVGRDHGVWSVEVSDMRILVGFAVDDTTLAETIKDIAQVVANDRPDSVIVVIPSTVSVNIIQAISVFQGYLDFNSLDHRLVSIRALEEYEPNFKVWLRDKAGPY